MRMGVPLLLPRRGPGAAATMLMLLAAAARCVARPYVVRAGVVMVERSVLPFKMEMVGPAIDMAMEVAERQYGIRFEKHISLYPDWCNAVATTGAIADLYYTRNISVLIGPGCSGDISVCGKLATHWRLPQVTGVGDLVLGKEDYPTLTRLSYSLEKQSVFVLTVLKHFGWSHIAIIYDTYDVLMQVQGRALTKALRATEGLPRPYDIEFMANKNPDYDAMLMEASQNARVLFVLASGGDLRQFLLRAHAAGMTGGDYAFITIELFRSEAWGDFSWKRGDENDAAAFEAYQSLFIMTLTEPAGPTWESFQREVVRRARAEYDFVYEEQVNYFVQAFYDGVIYLALALNRTIEDGEDPNDGLLVAQKLWNTTIPGLLGDVYIDSIGDRIADYSMLDMTELDNGTFHIVAFYYGASNELKMVQQNPIRWPRGAAGPPPDRPYCGFRGEEPRCQPRDMTVTIAATVGSISVFVLVGAVVAAAVYRKFRFEHALSNTSWKANWEDIVHNKDITSSTSRLSLANLADGDTTLSRMSKSRGSMTSSQGGGRQMFTTVGTYRGVLVAIRYMASTVKWEMNRKSLLEIKKIREVVHDNLTRFVGACVEPRHMCVLTEYCPKGSLEDILANEAIKLDWMFRYSLINDIVRGMCYLHGSPIEVHGRLKSSNCVVDSRFVLKITDFGLPSFYNIEESQPKNMHAFYRQKFWRAPELLMHPFVSTQPGDVYSFGIILGEVVTRQDPYEDEDLDPKLIVDRIMKMESPLFRPKIPKSECHESLYDLMLRCWSQSTQERPTFDHIRQEMRTISKGSGSGNILDNLLGRMEQYAENLEVLVEERTRAFLDEKKKSEELLYRVLPKSVADQLRVGKNVVPEKYECVTIYFSDIVGFTSLSARSTPLQVVDLLNDLYTSFDAIIDDFDVYKVETIGDAYMVVSGLPTTNGREHARHVARMSLALLNNAIGGFTIRHLPDQRIKLRIGLHSGPVVAGVVGLTMPRYCLFGDTVNTASRMESNGAPLKIHMSSSTTEILQSLGGFSISLRGQIDIKGKGAMTTYWLDGEDATTPLTATHDQDGSINGPGAD